MASNDFDLLPMDTYRFQSTKLPELRFRALLGKDSTFLHPRAVGEATGELLALAREQGVKRVVVLSAINVDDDLAEKPSRYSGDRNKEVEDAAVGSGLESARSHEYKIIRVQVQRSADRRRHPKG